MDSEKQKDEVTALQSMYNDEEFSYFEDNNLYKITMKIFPALPENFCITYKADNGTFEEKKVFIGNLPPLILSIVLPHDYPSLTPPKYTLRSSWLRYQAMLKLSKELKRLWELNKGQEILFTWMNFLQNDLLEFLNIKTSIDINHALTYYKESRLNSKGSSQICTTNNSSNSCINNNDNAAGSSKEHKTNVLRKVGKCRTHKLQDNRVICDIIANKNPVQMLIDYNEMKTQAEFMKNLFMCNICYSDKLGKYCTKFMPCSHVFCKECTANYVRTKIGDGSVQNILCPEEKCESELHLSQVKELLLPEEFYKFDSMLLSSTLDMMTDIIYCPRRNCQYPVSKEGDEKMATCPMCRYVFCIYCKMVYHGIEPCKMKIVVKNASMEEIEELKKRYGEKQVKLMIENSRSEDWIFTHSQMCPKCYTAIEKADGCNKMTCWKCGTYFCWNCLQKLDKNDPYMHFRNPSSRCFEKLWPREMEDEGDEDDNEAVEEQDLANNYFRLFYV